MVGCCEATAFDVYELFFMDGYGAMGWDEKCGWRGGVLLLVVERFLFFSLFVPFPAFGIGFRGWRSG